MSRWLVDKTSSMLETRVTRRSFVVKSAMAGSALVVAPTLYVLHPVTAYAAICNCADRNCTCGSACCDGYTDFCCAINGSNTCPPGSFPAGWWKADGSAYCSGARYYIDCNAKCTGCSTGCGTFCDSSCDTATCGCGLGDCNHRRVGCNRFRYGQCHQEIGCSGRIVCRVVSCLPPWDFDSSCATTSATDDATANHNAPCLQKLTPVTPPPPPHPPPPAPSPLTALLEAIHKLLQPVLGK